MKDRIYGMFAGVAIGDALGMPVETMTRGDIAKLNNGNGVTQYMDPAQRKVADTLNLHRGDTTDDWQLTSAVARALISSKGFNIHSQAREHLCELEKSTFGWGKGTMRSLEEIKSGIRSIGQWPLWSEPGKGSGNGVIMKISPLAALTAISGPRMSNNEILELCKLTHPDIRAYIATLPVFSFLFLALLQDPDSKYSDMMLDRDYFEILQIMKEEEKLHIEDETMRHFVSSYMSQVDISSIDTLINTAGVGFAAWQTASFALGVYFRHPRDFTSAILEAVNAGGDTDTNASVVGALVGATIGFSGIPEQWKDITALDEVREVTDSFCKTFLE